MFQETDAGIHRGVRGTGREAREERLGIGAVAKELGVVQQTLRNPVKAAEPGMLHPPGSADHHASSHARLDHDSA